MRSSTATGSHRWLFLGVISVGLFLIGADNSVLYAALPQLRQQLGASELETLWVLNAYPLVLSGLLLGSGTLGDKIGHRRMFEVGLLLFGGASLFAALASHPTWLIAGRALLGAGAAIMMPATLALLRITFTDPRERNTAIGIWASVATLGAASGPLLGGLLLEYFYWGSVFLINVPIALLAFGATQILAPANISDPQQRWDFISSLYAMLAMAGLVLVIKELANQSSEWALIGAAVLTTLGSLFFVIRQHKVDDPLLATDVFRNPVFTAGVVAAGTSMFVIAGTEMLTAQRFQLAEGYSPLQAGLVTAAMAISAFPTSVWGGMVLHRVGFRPLMSGGFALIALGIMVAAWASTLWIFVAGLMLGGLGAGLAMSVASVAIIGSAPAARAGMASSIEEVSFEFGTLLSVAVMGSLFAATYKDLVPSEISGSYESALSHPTLADAARSAIIDAYQLVLIAAVVAASCAMVITFYLLRGNPKETQYAHE